MQRNAPLGSTGGYMKNIIEKLKEEYGKNKIEISLMIVFVIAAMILNGPTIAREAALIYRTDPAATEETETDSEEEATDTGEETEAPETETEITEEEKKRLHRKLLSSLGSDFRIPMVIEEEETDLQIRELKDWYRLDGYEPLDPEVTGMIPAGEALQEYIDNKEERPLQDLEAILEEMIGQYDGAWSVYVKNLTSNESFVLNDQPMKSASVMKLFIMGTVYKAFEAKELERTDEIMSLVRDMIVDSDNEASNQLLYLLGDSSYADGIKKVDDFIQTYGFSSMTFEYNGFNDSATNTSSDHYNQVSAKDCGKLLEDIYRRTWVGRAVSNEMEELLLSQNTRYKIAAGLPDGVLCGNKTGEMNYTENDAAIIYGEKCDYILAVLSSDWESKDTAISRIQNISSVVYQYLNEAEE